MARIEYEVLDLDWSDDPPAWRRFPESEPTRPGGLDRADAEARERVLRALEACAEQGWEPVGDAWAATSLDRRERRVLLPTPGQPGSMWEEYRGAHVRIRRLVHEAEPVRDR